MHYEELSVRCDMPVRSSTCAGSPSRALPANYDDEKGASFYLARCASPDQRAALVAAAPALAERQPARKFTISPIDRARDRSFLLGQRRPKPPGQHQGGVAWSCIETVGRQC
jgi:hypothetical protein